MTPEMQAYIEKSGGLWKTLVGIAYHINPQQSDREITLLAEATSTTRETIRRKFDAIRHLREKGLSEEAIVRNGQGPTLKNFSQSRKQKVGEVDIFLRYRIPKSLGESWNELVSRLARVADLRTSEDLFEFLNSVFVGLSDAQIQNLAGELDPNRKARRV